MKVRQKDKMKYKHKTNRTQFNKLGPYFVLLPGIIVGAFLIWEGVK